MNPFKIKDKKGILKTKSDHLVSRLTGDVSEETTRVGFTERLLSQIKDFFLTLGKPRMKIRKAFGPPLSQDFNATMNEIEEDIHILFHQSKLIQNSTIEDFNYSRIEQDKLFYETNRLQEIIGDFEMYADTAGVLAQSGTETIYGSERFLNKDQIDTTLITKNQAHINTEGGFISLGLDGSVNHFEKVAPQIISGPPLANFPSVAKNIIGQHSNGFPGNTHEVYHTISSKEDSFTGSDNFAPAGGETGNIDLFYMIDGDPDTWFEYEVVNVPESEKQKVQPKDLGYNPSFCFDTGSTPLPWAFNPAPDDVLRLRLRFTLPEPQIISSITLSPFIPPNDGAMPAVVKSIDVYGSDIGAEEQNAVRVYDHGDDVHETIGTQIYTFNAINAKHIEVRLEQRGSFEALIGFFAHRREIVYQTTTKKFLSREKVEYDTESYYVEGPMIPVQAIGMIVDDHTGFIDSLANHMAGAGAFSVSISSFISSGLISTIATTAATPFFWVGMGLFLVGGLISLFRGKKETVVTSDEVITETHSAPGERWAIGIRDIQALSNSYKPSSEIISKPWSSGNPIRRVSLQSIHKIPSIFPTNEEWIKYSISVDQGTTWHRIQPENIPGDDHPTMYIINSTLEEDDLQDRVGYIESEEDIHNVMVKIELFRPTSGINQASIYTPIVDEYQIKMQVEVSPN